MEQPLFLDPRITMEKVAYNTRLDDDPEEWPTAITRESYKQLPFLKNYETEVELDRMEPARGYAVGKMLVWPARIEKTAAAKNKQLITVPIVVRDSEMAPLDVYSHSGNMLPMDQDKVASILFQPRIFERPAPRDQFTGTNLYGQLTPPNTDHQYNAGTLHKHGSVKEAMRVKSPKGGGQLLKYLEWSDKNPAFDRAKKETASLAERLSQAAEEGAKKEVPAHLRRPLHKHGSVKEATLASLKNPVEGVGIMARALRHARNPMTPSLVKKPVSQMGAINAAFTSQTNRSLLKKAMATFRAEDIEALGLRLEADAPLRHAYTTTPVLRAALEDLAGGYEKTASAMRDERLAHLKPTIIQMRESGKGYILKTANHRCYVPEERKISRYEAQELLTKTAFDKLLQNGRVTFTTDPVHTENLTVKTAQEADRLGVYEVKHNGSTVTGVVVPKVVDFNGRHLDMQIFAGPDSHSLQEKVAGVFVEDRVVQSDSPRGLGVFVYQEGPIAVATEPVRIEQKVKVAHQNGSHSTLLATRMSNGAPIRLTVVSGLQKIATIGEAEVALPDTVRFLALNGKQSRVSSSPGQVHDHEHAKIANANSVELISDGSFFSIRGHNSKAAFGNEMMTEGEAEFALAALGLTGAQASHAIKTASVHSSFRIPRSRPVLTEAQRGYEALEKAASAVVRVPDLRVDLVKEVALLTSLQAQELWKQASVTLSKESTDAILSLGFVTPENASLYVNYLPDLEKVAGKLAELLVASRLGMDDVRESAAKNAMTQVNAVIRGLETLRERIH